MELQPRTTTDLDIYLRQGVKFHGRDRFQC